jgi:putative membrane protein
MNGMMGGNMETWLLFKMVASFLFILALVLAIAWGVQWAVRGGVGRTEDSALEILKRRYARGEISKEEFEEKKRDIA